MSDWTKSSWSSSSTQSSGQWPSWGKPLSQPTIQWPSSSSGSKSVTEWVDRQSLNRTNGPIVTLSTGKMVGWNLAWERLVNLLNQTNLHEYLLGWLELSTQNESQAIYHKFSRGLFMGLSVGECLQYLNEPQMLMFYAILLEHAEYAARAIFLINLSPCRNRFLKSTPHYQTALWASRLLFATPFEEKIVIGHYLSNYHFDDPVYQDLFNRARAQSSFWPLAVYLIALDDPATRQSSGQSLICIPNLDDFWKNMWAHLWSVPIMILLGEDGHHMINLHNVRPIVNHLSDHHPQFKAWLTQNDIQLATQGSQLILQFCDLHVPVKVDVVIWLKRNLFGPLGRDGWTGLPVLPDELTELINHPLPSVSSCRITVNL